MHYWFEKTHIYNGGEEVKLNYNFSVDWGDGSPIEKFSHDENIAKGINHVSKCKHYFKKEGIYRVTLLGEVDALYGYNGNTYEGNKRSKSLINTLRGLIVPKNCYSPLKYAPGTFFGCEKLEYLGNNVFDNLTTCTSVAHLFDGAKITQLPDGLLDKCVNLEDASYIFEACDIIYVPRNIFHNCPKLTNVEHAFHRSNKLKRVPDDLFANNPLITNASECFRACKSLEDISGEIFDNCPLLDDVSYTFANNAFGDYPNKQYIKKIPPLWERENPPSKHVGYAAGCQNASNWNEVPDGWK